MPIKPYDYNLAVGSVWKYGNFFAPFDIETKYNATEIDSIRNDINEGKIKGYFIESGIEPQVKKTFDTLFPYIFDVQKMSLNDLVLLKREGYSLIDRI